MSRLIQIRNVPEDVHRKAKARAAEAGMSMSDYLLREIEQSLKSPTHEELLEKIASQKPLELKPEPWKVIRELRDSA